MNCVSGSCGMDSWAAASRSQQPVTLCCILSALVRHCAGAEGHDGREPSTAPVTAGTGLTLHELLCLSLQLTAIRTVCAGAEGHHGRAPSTASSGLTKDAPLGVAGVSVPRAARPKPGAYSLLCTIQRRMPASNLRPDLACRVQCSCSLPFPAAWSLQAASSSSFVQPKRASHSPS